MGGASGARTGKISMAAKTTDQMAWRAAALLVRGVRITVNATKATNARHNERIETSANCSTNRKLRL
jgi:hypothetical protein